MSYSYLKSANASYIDELYESYCRNPESVDPTWRYFFEGLELNGLNGLQPTVPASGGISSAQKSTPEPTSPAAASKPSVAPQAAQASPPVQMPVSGSTELSAEARVSELITSYREHGRLLAKMDPLSSPPESHPFLELSRFGLSQEDLGKVFFAGRLIGLQPCPLSEIVTRLKETYCQSIGVEFTHIHDTTERDWLLSKMESSRNRENLDVETKKLILKRLSESETFERFLHTRYVAQKRFSLEGGESLIPTLDCIFEVGAELGADEFVVGMAHRGRLNVLCNTFGKKPEFIFTEFEGTYKADTSMGEGDVKYHQGYSADIQTRRQKKVHLSLASNPSHLEFVNPVIEGGARAKQQLRKDSERTKVVPISIHGDAAFAGQGVCYETINLSQLTGYRTGGTIHIVINNQVGFTAPPEDSRSTPYATDMGKMLQVPIFHVNGDDPEALWFVAKLCIEYKQKFRKDVFIDLICYRKHGHNEGDEPTFTQPVLYKKIKSHKSTRELYSDRLIAEGVITASESQDIINSINESLIKSQAITKAEAPKPPISVFQGQWQGLKRPTESDLFKPVLTFVPETTLKELAEKLNAMPKDFQLHSKLSRFFEARLKAVREGKGIDWGNAETLAFASLLVEGNPVRLSGQDSERGTFTHRHSVLNDFETGMKYAPLNHLQEGQAVFEVYNSHLSETGVLGFEYGYSLADPQSLVIWEAQFGDFANGAQVIIDQFISSSESKWQRMCGIVLLLPHGFEGQGPEHSSARLERFLQLCGKNNMFVVNLTTPAQFFHALRRQLKRDFRKPLVVMSPKSMLRNPLAISEMKEFTHANFEEVLDDPTLENEKAAQNVQKLILCTGKIYYDLFNERNTAKRADVAIIRIEQLYPFPADKLEKIIARYKNLKNILWVQEEPRNMGAWTYLFSLWHGGYSNFQTKAGGKPLQYVGREICAAPAVGSHKLHEVEQHDLIQKAIL